MQRITITIIGMGPRGLSVLERLCAIAPHRPYGLDLVVIDPGEGGQGVHLAQQPQHLLINTLASQVTLFPAAGVVRHAPVCATPTLTEWARRQGYRRVGDAEYRLARSGAGREIGECDYLPRCLLGEYLSWVWRQLCAALPPGAQLRHYRRRAVDLWPGPDGRLVVELDGGVQLPSDAVFLCTGHGGNRISGQEAGYAEFAQAQAHRNSRLAYLRPLYPLARLEQISPAARVLVHGMGLSAHDAVAELTVGRGGTFVATAAGLRYQRSGREPQLLLSSRHGLPAAARGVNQKGLTGRHPARYFTPQAIAALRAQARRARGSPQLDFEAELLPLLQREMALAYRQACDARRAAAPAGGGERCQAAVPRAPLPEDLAVVAALWFPVGAQQFASLAACRAFFAGWLRVDLAHARQGNLGSPVKAATDVLRDVRASLQAAVEQGGLTPASHRQFLTVYNPIINRIAFGPPARRNAEWLALLDAGVLQLGGGPGATIGMDPQAATFVLQSRFASGVARLPFDVLLPARLDAFYPQTEAAPLIGQLLRRGLARPYCNGDFHPGGLDINQAGQVLDAAGQPSAPLWALGYPVEGPHYYTHALPRPQMRSRQVRDADRCVNAMFKQMAITRRARAGVL